MSTLLTYALIQVFHNVGALLILVLSSRGLGAARRHQSLRIPAFLACLAWLAQGLTGALFGLETWHSEHQWPDIHGVAVAALLLKMICVAGGILLTGSCALWGIRWSAARQMGVWTGSLLLGMVALTAAAFLRWFS